MIVIRESDGTEYSVRLIHGVVKLVRRIDQWTESTWAMQPDIALQIADAIVDAVECSALIYEDDNHEW